MSSYAEMAAAARDELARAKRALERELNSSTRPDLKSESDIRQWVAEAQAKVARFDGPAGDEE